nr:hypothetical protein [uncultured Psychroserpens sp.]
MSFLTKIFKKKSNKTYLILNPKGKNSIGGKAPAELIIPKLETSPIVYLGMISKHESALKLIDFNFHLVCPIFIDLQQPVFFDYTNALSPKLIRENIDSNFNILFDDIPANAYIEYKKLNFYFDNPKPTKIKIGVHELEVVSGEIGHTGQPNWIQNDAWPLCPITGNKMEFLFQLGDIDDCKTKFGQEILDKESIDPYLSFGHGYLYVFYEPSSKIVAYINQI